MTSFTINGNGGLISNRDIYSQPMGVQENKSKHKSAQQTIKEK
jgi:hypothetical protein